MPNNLRALREAKGLTIDAAAGLFDLSRSGYQKIERGERRLSAAYIAKAAKIYGVPTAAVIDEALPPEVRVPVPEFFGARDLPVFAATEGGPGEMVVSTDPIQFVPRPWFLAHVREGYGVIVTGESMVPVYEPGDMVLVNPKLPALRGKNAIFVGGEEHGDFKATVKRLEWSLPDRWQVRQWNEPREFDLSKREWPRALRIVGKYEGS